MESYGEFLERINSFEKPDLAIDPECFIPSQSVLQKVDSHNCLSPFYGDTIVFNLSDVVKERIHQMIVQLYSQVPECFSEMLLKETLHMTLHDLSNSPNFDEIKDEVLENEKRVYELFSKEVIRLQEIHMKSNYIINMVNTSLVLALYPSNEEEYNKLIRLYDMVDKLKKLPYPLTPHITLAYYSHFGFGKTSSQKLVRVVKELNQNSVDITLSTSELFYQKFNSMNSFQNILRLGGNGR